MVSGRSSRPRILVVDDGVGLWGAQHALLHVAPALRQAGYELLLLAPRETDMARTWATATGGCVLDLAGPRLTVRSPAGRISALPTARVALSLWRRSRSISRAARQVGARLMVANSFWSHYDVALAGRMSHTPTLLYLHELVHPGLPRRALRLALALSQGAIAVSDDVAACVGTSKVRVIPNGVDMELFSPGPASSAVRAELACTPARPLVVTVCRIDESKQVDHVIRAVAALGAGPDAPCLAVVGTTTTSETYAASVKELGARLLGERVRFVEPRRDVPDVLRNADVYVLASREEGMGIGIIEAQSVGCPVVAYQVPGVRSVVEAGRSGVLAPAGDWQALGRGIHDVLSDGTFRQALTAAARESVRQRFTLARQASAVVAYVAELTGRSRNPS